MAIPLPRWAGKSTFVDSAVRRMMNIVRMVAQRWLIIGFGAVTCDGRAAAAAHAGWRGGVPTCSYSSNTQHTRCVDYVSGGTAPYAIRWNGTIGIDEPEFHTIGPVVISACKFQYEFTVTASDATHRLNGHAQISGECGTT